MAHVPTSIKLTPTAQAVLNNGVESLQSSIPVKQLTHPSRSRYLENLAFQTIMANGKGVYTDNQALTDDIRSYFRTIQ